MLQFLLLIPVVRCLYTIQEPSSHGMSRATMVTAVAALGFTILLLLLIFPKILTDTLYMFPQGIFGVCLIVINAQRNSILSRGLRRFGMLVGFGLAMVGCFPVGYTIFVDTFMLKIPAVDPNAVANPDTTANNIIHLILMIGTLLGVVTLPIYTILVGKRLLREKVNGW